MCYAASMFFTDSVSEEILIICLVINSTFAAFNSLFGSVHAELWRVSPIFFPFIICLFHISI
jgi:hypothetical protein